MSAPATATAGPPRRPHRTRINGIFKVRDMREGLWDPAVEFLSDFFVVTEYTATANVFDGPELLKPAHFSQRRDILRFDPLLKLDIVVTSL